MALVAFATADVISASRGFKLLESCHSDWALSEIPREMSELEKTTTCTVISERSGLFRAHIRVFDSVVGHL